MRTKVILDCDDVLYQCNQYAIQKLNSEKGTSFKCEDIRRWGILGNVLDERIKYFQSPEFFRNIPVFDGAKAFVHELSKKTEVFIATSVPANCAGERVTSIIQNFPEIDPGNILIGHRKDLLNADFLLDDAIHNIRSAQVKYPVLFRRPWNHDVSGILSVTNYQEFLTLLDIADSNSYRKRTGKIVCLVGSSGSGKTDIYEDLIGLDDFMPVKTYTTRQCQRLGDHPYHFISEDQFMQLKSEEFFFETSCYANKHYGIAMKDIEDVLRLGKCPVLVLDINGAIAMKRYYGDDCTNIFIEREKNACIREVLMRSNATMDEVVHRLGAIDDEFKNKVLCDYSVCYSMQAAAQIIQIMEGNFNE